MRPHPRRETDEGGGGISSASDLPELVADLAPTLSHLEAHDLAAHGCMEENEGSLGGRPTIVSKPW
jgi:hypothetical protein